MILVCNFVDLFFKPFLIETVAWEFYRHQENLLRQEIDCINNYAFLIISGGIEFN